MASLIVTFANLLLAALMVGGMFGAFLIFNPAGLSAGTYVTLQQQGIRKLHPSMPPLGAATVLLTLVSAVFARNDQTRLWILVATAVCFISAGLITKFLNMPINAIVITWSSDAPPANWTDFRDRWWRWHRARLAAGFVGLLLLIAITLRDVKIG